MTRAYVTRDDRAAAPSSAPRSPSSSAAWSSTGARRSSPTTSSTPRRPCLLARSGPGRGRVHRRGLRGGVAARRPWNGDPRSGAPRSAGRSGTRTTPLQREILRDMARGIEQRLTAQRLGIGLRSLSKEVHTLTAVVRGVDASGTHLSVGPVRRAPHRRPPAAPRPSHGLTHRQFSGAPPSAPPDATVLAVPRRRVSATGPPLSRPPGRIFSHPSFQRINLQRKTPPASCILSEDDQHAP